MFQSPENKDSNNEMIWLLNPQVTTRALKSTTIFKLFDNWYTCDDYLNGLCSCVIYKYQNRNNSCRIKEFENFKLILTEFQRFVVFFNWLIVKSNLTSKNN